jgi:hypothetical protein
MMRYILPFVLGVALAAPSTVFAKKDKAPLPGLLVKMGETWAFQIEKGQPVKVRASKEGDTLAPGEVQVSLSNSTGTLMTVKNNAGTWLNYKAFMTPKEGKKGTPTSVCTVMSQGRMGVEMWPYAIPAIRITEFIPAAEGEMVCK